MFGDRTKYSVGCLAAFLTFIVLVAFFIGPYYWPSSGASWAAGVRSFLFICLIFYLVSGASFKSMGKLGLVCLLFFLYLLVNAILVGQDSQSARRVIYVLCFVLVVACFWREPAMPRVLLMVIAVAGALFAGFSLLNLFRLEELHFIYRKGAIFDSGVPGVADFGNTIVAALHYAACYCAALWLMFASRNKYAALAWFLCTLVIGLYIIMTFSRTGWVACLIASLVLLALALRDRGNWQAKLVVLVLAGLLVVFLNGYFAYEVNIRGLTHRDEIWAIVLQRMDSHWLLGHGGGSTIEPIPIVGGRIFVHNTHNLYLEVLYRFGVVGLVLMVATLGFMVKELAQASLREKALPVSAYGLALVAASVFIMVVELNHFVDSPNLVWIWFWLPLGIALSVAARGTHVKS